MTTVTTGSQVRGGKNMDQPKQRQGVAKQNKDDHELSELVTE